MSEPKSSDESKNLAKRPIRIAVIGAGVVGLTTAVQLQTAMPSSAKITLIADRFEHETTSYGAAGVFRVRVSPPSTQNPVRVRKWVRDSWDYFSRLVNSAEAGNAGCQMMTGYEYCNEPRDTHVDRDYLYAYERMREKAELSIYPGQDFKHGYRVSSILIFPRRFLPYLMSNFLSRGGKRETRKIESMDELVNQYDLVINCTGLGARDLVADHEMLPVRGQVIYVHAPWIKTYLYTQDEQGNTLYVYPTADLVVIGGFYQQNDSDLRTREEETAQLWSRALDKIPSLAHAQRLGERVGLRPGRGAGIRVEAEVMRCGAEGELKVVHNYGHGGYGISLCWGTSKEAVNMAQTLLNSNAKL